MSNSILKSNWVVCKPGEARIIDSNGFLEEKIKKEAGMFPHPAPEGNTEDDFTPGIFGQEYEEIIPEENMETLNEEAQQSFTQNTEEILMQAQAQVEELKQQALQEIELERQRAVEEGRQQGFEEGYQEGKLSGIEDGKREGMESIELQRQEMLSDIAQNAARQEQEYKERMDALEPKMVEIITEIYEKVFQVELKNNKDLVVNLLANAMKNLEGIKRFLVHVSKEDYPLVSMQKKEMIRGTNIMVENIDLVEDSTLVHGQCMIETDNGIYDCSLDTQLDTLNDELMILSYKTENAENTLE